MYKPIQYIDKAKINPGIRYKEFKPSASLTQYVACYWIVYSIHEISNVLHRVIPDGCIDIIYNFQEKKSFISGISDKTDYFILNGNIFYFGIRFLPNATSFILKCNASSGLNSAIEIDSTLEILWQMTEKIFIEKNINNLITIFQTHLESFFKNYKINNKFNIILKHSLDTGGAITVQNMALYHGISEKQI